METDMEALGNELYEVRVSAMETLNMIETIEENYDATCIEKSYWKELQALKRACKPLALKVVEVK